MGTFNTGTSLDFDYDKFYRDVAGAQPGQTIRKDPDADYYKDPTRITHTDVDNVNTRYTPLPVTPSKTPVKTSVVAPKYSPSGVTLDSITGLPHTYPTVQSAYYPDSLTAYGSEIGYYPEGLQQNAVVQGIERATSPSLLGLNFMNDVALRAGGPMAGLSVWDTGSGAVPPDDVGKGVWGRLAMGSGGSQEGMVLGGAPGAVSSPMFHRSDLTGATPKVAYHSKPITHDRVPPKAAGQRYDVMGRDMAFMPTSVQTSSRWDTGY